MRGKIVLDKLTIIPITNPKQTPSTTPEAVTTIDSDHQKTEEKPFGKGDESSVAKIASSEKENGKSNGGKVHNYILFSNVTLSNVFVHTNTEW